MPIVPVAILQGGRDNLSNTDFLFRHLQRPPVLVLKIEEYEHLDFLWATGVSKTVNPAVVGVLESFARKSGVWEENVDRVLDPYDVERMWQAGSVRRDNGQLVLGGSISVWNVLKECEERARIGAASPKKTPTVRSVGLIGRTPPTKKSAEKPKPPPQPTQSVQSGHSVQQSPVAQQPLIYQHQQQLPQQLPQQHQQIHYQVPVQTVRLSPAPSPPKPKSPIEVLPPLAKASKPQPGFFTSLTNRFASVVEDSDGESDDSLPSRASMDDTYIIAG